jgi:tRNA(Ile)-lysidine synthase
MLHQLHNISRHCKFTLACSGGVDSMAVADFYSRGGKNFVLAYFDHGTGNVHDAMPVIRKFADRRGIEVVKGKIQSEKPKDLSPEEHWRNERYRWLISLERPIVTCHHLNDVAETWVFSALHGNPKLIQHQGVVSSYGKNEVIYRPFLTNTKRDLISWCTQHEVSFHEDASNEDFRYPRNFIRHKLMPGCLQVNPGLLKTLKKKILATVK